MAAAGLPLKCRTTGTGHLPTFSSQHIGYTAANQYILKSKQLTDVLHSMDHPNLGNISQNKTKTAMNSNRKSKSKKKDFR